MIENFEFNNEKWAYVIRGDYSPKNTEFFSSDEDILQLGFIVYNKDEKITPHLHTKATRIIKGTPEVLIVKKGKILTTFYNVRKEKVGEKILYENDIIVLLKGGHGFEMIEDSILIEVKQGPYLGNTDKIKFAIT